ncbi:MAG: prolipoprotein diacylglyceryl transferase [Planctomycetota bacterium]
MMPELIRIGPFPLHSYGAMVLLGVLGGLWLLRKGCRARGFDPDIATDLTIWSVLAGVVGARVFYVVQYWGSDEVLAASPLLGPFMIWKGGLVLFGGILGGLLCMLTLLHRHRLPTLTFLDLVAPGLAVGIAFGRIGCFLNGCCWGKVCAASFPLGVSYPSDLQTPVGHSLAVHPTQLYSSLAAFFMAWICWRLNVHRLPPGVTTGILGILYGATRFTVETIRGDHDPAPGAWTVSQQISGGLLLLGVALVAHGVLRHRRRIAPAAA